MIAVGSVDAPTPGTLNEDIIDPIGRPPDEAIGHYVWAAANLSRRRAIVRSCRSLLSSGEEMVT